MAIIYQAFDIGESTLKVHVTRVADLAPLWVYMVSDRALAHRPGCWYATSNFSEAQHRIYFGSWGVADLNVFFVDAWGKAGWQRESEMKGLRGGAL